jgi:hypothetical protein
MRTDSAIGAALVAGAGGLPGLRVPGVRVRPGQDGYQAIRLAKYRHTEEWAAELAPPAS